MKIKPTIIGWSWIGIGWLIVGMIGCHQKLPPQTIEQPFLLKEIDSLAFGEQATADSLLPPALDSLLHHSNFLKSTRYEEIFAPNTAYETRITVYKVHLDTAVVTLLNGNYSSLAQVSKNYPKDYLMLTNGGMFHPQGAPVGLFQNGNGQLKGVNQEQGYGNFFLHPNGVFYITKDNQAGVLETQVFLDSIYNKETALQLATQSGPMLVMEGAYHPKFNKSSPNKYIRSGVGVTDQQELLFILSEELVNFHTFAKIFIEKGCKNALYLDGAISSMYIKDRRDSLQDFTTKYGPVIGVYFAKDSSLIQEPKDSLLLEPLQQDSFPTINNDSLPPPNLLDNATEK